MCSGPCRLIAAPIEPTVFCPPCSSFPSSPGCVEGLHQLLINFIEVDSDHATGPPHAIAREFIVGNESAHGTVADLEALSGFGDGDVAARHYIVQGLNLPSRSRLLLDGDVPRPPDAARIELFVGNDPTDQVGRMSRGTSVKLLVTHQAAFT